jgi:hypothetical protein
MALLQWETFALGGEFRADAAYATLPAIGLGALGVSIAASYLQLEAGGAGRLRALAYFSMQALSGACAVYDTRLYVVGLTLHYVEYHVMMKRRCFAPPPAGELGAVDRVYRPLRVNPPLFYALLLALVVLFELRNHVGTLPATTTFFVHIFDGIFLVHYVIEAFLWRFREPYYRDSLGPLYFGEQEPRAPTAPRRSGRVTAAALGITLVALGLSGALSPAARALKQRLIDPMHADNHMRWSERLLRRGDLAGATVHAEEARRRAPGPEADALLRAIQQARGQ